MNTSLGPNLTDLETIHSLAWRVTATASVAFGRARSTAVWRRETRYTPRVDAGKGTAYAVERPEWRSLQPRRNKARGPRAAIRPCGVAAWHGASLRLVAGWAQRPAE